MYNLNQYLDPLYIALLTETPSCISASYARPGDSKDIYVEALPFQ